MRLWTHASVTSEASTPIETPAARAWRRFRRHRLAITGLVALIVLAIMAIFAPFFTQYDPLAVDLYNRSQAPGGEHWLGTDRTGRDVWARTVYAGRVSLSVGLVAVAVSGTVGTLLGAVAGFYGGRVDNTLMRLTDVIMSFPPLIVILTVVAIIGPNIRNIMVVIGLLSWPPLGRLIRAQFLATKERDFVLAARCLGIPTRQIIFRHILPHAVAPLMVFVTFGMANAILLEAGLSFLGIGVPPPTPSWGNMLNQARSLEVLEQLPWAWVPPGIATIVAVTSINFIGDGLRDALDPRMRLD
jgi:peptide/nickel transport system permease protein